MIITMTKPVIADCYYNLSPYWAVTKEFPSDNSTSHKDYIALENEHGRPVDGIMMNNNLYALSDEHPTERVQKTDDMCRMLVPQQPGQQAFYHISPFNPEPSYFKKLIYVRFECGYSKTCAIDE